MRLDISHYLTKQAITAPNSSSRWRLRRIRLSWLIGVVLVGLLVLGAVLPSFIGAHYLAAGADALAIAAAGPAGSQQVADAVVYLEQARKWTPSDPQVYRVLAESYLQQNQPQLAVAALEQAFRLQPGSLLIRQELAQAYAAAGQVRRAAALWEELGMTAERMVALGDERLQSGDYLQASQWYERSIRLHKQQSSVVFRSAIAAIMAGRPLPQPLDQAALTIHPVSDSVQIEARTLQWMFAIPDQHLDYGNRLVEFPSSDQTVGVMWWKGLAVAVVQVQHGGSYQVTVRARHSTPVIGQLQVENGDAPIALFSLTETWQEFKATTTLSPGLHIIGLRYMKDAGDAIIDRVELQRSSDSAQ